MVESFFGSRPCQTEFILVCMAIHISFRYRLFVEIHECICARFCLFITECSSKLFPCAASSCAFCVAVIIIFSCAMFVLYGDALFSFSSSFSLQYSPLFIPTDNNAIFCFSKFQTHIYKAEAYQKEKLYFFHQQKKFSNQQYLFVELCI